MSAVTPQFEIVKVFAFDATGIAEGSVSGLADDGTFAGFDHVNGSAAPAIWDSSGNRTLLDTSGISFTSVNRSVLVQSSQLVAANLWNDEPNAWPRYFGVRWQGATTEVLGGTAVTVNDMNSDGKVSGIRDSNVAHWDSMGSSGWMGVNSDAAMINAFGDVAYFTPPVVDRETNVRTRRELSVWKMNGPDEILRYPPDLDAQIDAQTWSNESLLRYYDDGSALAHIQIPYAEGRYRRTVRCRTTGGDYIEGLTGRGVQILIANRTGMMHGYSYDDSQPFHLRNRAIHTVWIDGVPIRFLHQVTNAADYSDYQVTTLSDSGRIAGVARDKSTGAWHGVLFNRK